MIVTLAQRELRSLFYSPLAWSILAIMQFIIAYLFLGQVEQYLQRQAGLVAFDVSLSVTESIIAPMYGNAAIVLLLVVPMLTMRLISEERRNQTLSLLLSAPVSMSEIIVGKYLGIMGFLSVLLLLTMLMPLSLLLGASLDWGMLVGMLLGVLLLVASFAALGLYISCLTQQPTIAAVGTFGVLLLLWVLDWGGGQAGSTTSGSVLQYLSLLHHYQSMLVGLVKSSDVGYFILFITTFLGLAIRRLDADRLR